MPGKRAVMNKISKAVNSLPKKRNKVGEFSTKTSAPQQTDFPFDSAGITGELQAFDVHVNNPDAYAADLPELVNHPAHYGGDTVYEVIKVLEFHLSFEEFCGFCKGNNVKYTLRAGKKSGEERERDIAKAKWYTDRLNAYLAKHKG